MGSTSNTDTSLDLAISDTATAGQIKGAMGGLFGLLYNRADEGLANASTEKRESIKNEILELHARTCNAASEIERITLYGI